MPMQILTKYSGSHSMVYKGHRQKQLSSHYAHCA